MTFINIFRSIFHPLLTLKRVKLLKLVGHQVTIRTFFFPLMLLCNKLNVALCVLNLKNSHTVVSQAVDEIKENGWCKTEIFRISTSLLYTVSNKTGWSYSATVYIFRCSDINNHLVKQTFNPQRRNRRRTNCLGCKTSTLFTKYSSHFSTHRIQFCRVFFFWMFMCFLLSFLLTIIHRWGSQCWRFTGPTGIPWTLFQKRRPRYMW